MLMCLMPVPNSCTSCVFVANIECCRLHLVMPPTSASSWSSTDAAASSVSMCTCARRWRRSSNLQRNKFARLLYCRRKWRCFQKQSRHSGPRSIETKPAHWCVAVIIVMGARLKWLQAPDCEPAKECLRLLLVITAMGACPTCIVCSYKHQIGSQWGGGCFCDKRGGHPWVHILSSRGELRQPATLLWHRHGC